MTLRHFLTSLLLASFFVTGTVSAEVYPETVTDLVPSTVFSDVTYSHPYFYDIDELSRENIISGLDGKFYPGQDVTRAEMAKFVVKGANLTINVCDGSPHFSDVAPEHPLYDYVETAYCYGIISGRGEGIFAPDSPVLRQEAVKMIVTGFQVADREQGTDYFKLATSSVSERNPLLEKMDEVSSFEFDLNIDLKQNIDQLFDMNMTVISDGVAGEDENGNIKLEAYVSLSTIMTGQEEGKNMEIELSGSADIKFIGETFYFYLKNFEYDIPEDMQSEEMTIETEETINKLIRRWISLDGEMAPSFGNVDNYENSIFADTFLDENVDYFDFELIKEGENYQGVVVDQYQVNLNQVKYNQYKNAVDWRNAEKFPDVSANSEFQKYIRAGSGLSLYLGLSRYDWEEDPFFGPNNEFYPEKILKRGEAAALINNARHLLSGERYQWPTEEIVYSAGELYIGQEDGYVYYVNIDQKTKGDFGEGHMVLEIDFSEFNEPVEIEIPETSYSYEEFMEEVFGFSEL